MYMGINKTGQDVLMWYCSIRRPDLCYTTIGYGHHGGKGLSAGDVHQEAGNLELFHERKTRQKPSKDFAIIIKKIHLYRNNNNHQKSFYEETYNVSPIPRPGSGNYHH